MSRRPDPDNYVKCNTWNCRNLITTTESRRQRGMCVCCLNRMNEGSIQEELIDRK